jgi:hypothetical protein
VTAAPTNWVWEELESNPEYFSRHAPLLEDRYRKSGRYEEWMMDGLVPQLKHFRTQAIKHKVKLKELSADRASLWEYVLGPNSPFTGLTIMKYFYMICLTRGKSSATVEALNSAMGTITRGLNGNRSNINWVGDRARNHFNGPPSIKGMQYVLGEYEANAGLLVRSKENVQELTDENQNSKKSKRQKKSYKKNAIAKVQYSQNKRNEERGALAAAQGATAKVLKTRVRKRAPEQIPMMVPEADEEQPDEEEAPVYEVEAIEENAFTTYVQYEKDFGELAVARTGGKRTRSRSPSPSTLSR